jgi:hypothetical protein
MGHSTMLFVFPDAQITTFMGINQDGVDLGTVPILYYFIL